MVCHGISHGSLVFFSRQVEYLMVYYGKALSHAVKYAMHAQHYRGDIREARDGKAGLSTVEYTTAILYSNWLYFLRHGIMWRYLFLVNTVNFWLDGHLNWKLVESNSGEHCFPAKTEIRHDFLVLTRGSTLMVFTTDVKEQQQQQPQLLFIE